VRWCAFGYLALACFLVFQKTSCAAEALPEKLSVADAVAMALDINPSLKQAEEGSLSAQSRLRIAQLETFYTIGSEASMERDPYESQLSSRLYGSLSYRNLYGTEASLDLSPFGVGSQRGSVGLTLRHPLMKRRGLLSERADLRLSALSEVNVQSKELYVSQQSTMRRVVEAYYDAVLEREQVKVLERAVSIAEELADGTRKREVEGLVTGIEVSRAEINVAQTRDQLNLQRASARGAMDRLMLAIGAGVGQNPELTDSVPDVDPEQMSLEEAIKEAVANRPELAVYDVRLSNQQRRLAIRNDELRPGLDAVAGFSSSNGSSGLISGSIIDQGSLTAGVEFTFPLDKRISTEERDTTARELRVLEKLRVYETELIAEEVRNAFRALESARVSLEIYSQNLSVAREGLRRAQRMVEEGEGSNREVLDAQRALSQVESGMLEAKTRLYLATINLKLAIGKDLTDTVLK
jgi:outer membrane protein TolC